MRLKELQMCKLGKGVPLAKRVCHDRPYPTYKARLFDPAASSHKVENRGLIALLKVTGRREENTLRAASSQAEIKSGTGGAWLLVSA